MYSAEFDYEKVNSLTDAIRLLGSTPDSKLLAGGHSLIPMMKLRLSQPALLVDISGISGLKGIRLNNGMLEIGPLTTHYEIATSSDVSHSNPLMTMVANGIGDPQVRNRGTIGGNLAHADPASDWATVLTALGATIHIQGSDGSRTVEIGDFIEGPFSTVLDEGEIITSIHAPVLSGHRHEEHGGHDHGHHDDHGHEHEHGAVEIHGEVGEYAKMAHPASFYAVIGGAVIVTVEDNRCTAARVAVGGLVPKPIRTTSVENALIGKELTSDNVTDAVNHMYDDLGDDILGDVYASADFRRNIAPIEVKHALLHATGVAHH